jgi:hypothetical protein
MRRSRSRLCQRSLCGSGWEGKRGLGGAGLKKEWETPTMSGVASGANCDFGCQAPKHQPQQNAALHRLQQARYVPRAFPARVWCHKSPIGTCVFSHLRCHPIMLHARRCAGGKRGSAPFKLTVWPSSSDRDRHRTFDDGIAALITTREGSPVAMPLRCFKDGRVQLRAPSENVRVQSARALDATKPSEASGPCQIKYAAPGRAASCSVVRTVKVTTATASKQEDSAKALGFLPLQFTVYGLAST